MRSGKSPGESYRDVTGYDPTTETFHTQHEWDGDQSLAITIAKAIAVVANTGPTAIDPLYEGIDPQALEQFLRSARDAEHRSSAAVQFVSSGYPVTVRADGEVCVHGESERDRPNE